MIDHTTALYCITDDLLKATGHADDARSVLTDAEVITTALVAALYFGGNIERSRSFMRSTGLMPRMLSKSRLTRRLHRVTGLVNRLFHQLGLVLKEASPSTRYLLDSFPVAVCDNMRISRCRLVSDEEFRGYIASKRRYFYGVRVQVVTTGQGVPVELAFLPGAASDVRGLGVLPLTLPRGSQLFMDSGLLAKDARLRRALSFERVPHRTTIGRRLMALVPEAEQQIASLGRQIMAEVEPAASQSEVSALDGRMYKAQGPLWHKKDREKGRIPVGLRNVDTESKWSKSGYRGWIQGYRLVLQGLAFPAPVPVFAAWRANHECEAQVATAALRAGRLHVTDVLLGDETFGAGGFPQAHAAAGGWVLTPKQLPEERRSWKDDLYDYRKQTIELLFQRLIQAVGLKECPVKGTGRNGAFVLASVWLYQMCFLADYRAGKPLAHIKDRLDCARWRIPSG